MATFEVGYRFEQAPLPHDAASTKLVAGGSIMFGVEYRVVDEAALVAGYGAEAVAETGTGFDEHGVSIHVFGAVDELEYLRFDCFADEPHYHYISPGTHQVIVPFDQVANEDVLQWTFSALEQRLPEMLTFVGADELAAAATSSEVRRALAEVRTVAESVVREQAAALAANNEKVSHGT